MVQALAQLFPLPPRRFELEKPSAVTGWIPAGKEVEVLERVRNGTDTWARVGQGQFAAIEYQGVKYLE